MKKRYEYIGDINLEYGGTYINLADVKHGYAECVRITDLESATGFESAVMVEHLIAILEDPATSKRMQSALDCCGYKPEDLPRKGTKGYWIMLVDAALSYGLYDPDDSWAHYSKPARETIQQEKDGPMSFDGWEADKNLKGKNLKYYIQRNHL